MPIRSGRFKSLKPKTSPLQPIIGAGAGKDSAFYRILNSGANEFTVNWGSRSERLRPAQSLDISVRNAEVTITSTADLPIEGIYDFLDVYRDIRSGRFKNGTMGSGSLATSQKIIDATGAKNAAYYRIYNSGTAPIKIVGSTTLDRLEPDLSYDMKVDKAVVTVEEAPAASGGGPVGQIEGIYEFLGE